MQKEKVKFDDNPRNYGAIVVFNDTDSEHSKMKATGIDSQLMNNNKKQYKLEKEKESCENNILVNEEFISQSLE